MTVVPMKVHNNRFAGKVATTLSAYQSILIKALAIAIGLSLWELYAMGQPPYLFPRLGEILRAFVEQLNNYELIPRFLNSMKTLFVGFLLAVIVGVSIGLLMGIDKRVGNALNPYINAFYTAPISASIPFIIIVGGASFQSRVFIVFMLSVFEVLIDTYEGVQSTPQGLLQVARSFGGDRIYTLRNVIIPHDVPFIIAGIRLGIGRAIKGMILAELLIEFANLGAIIRLWENSYRIEGVLSIVLLLMILGIALTRTVKVLGDRLLAWRPEEAR